MAGVEKEIAVSRAPDVGDAARRRGPQARPELRVRIVSGPGEKLERPVQDRAAARFS
jgi:hypothetical protein